MDLISTAEEIIRKTREIEGLSRSLDGLAIERASKAAEYEKDLASTILKLKNGIEFELDGEIVRNPPVTTMDKLARGICWRQRLESDVADLSYRNAMKRLDMLSGVLNAYQSLHRYHGEVR